MATKKEKEHPVVLPADASALIHKDRSGAATNVGLTEGRDNFGTVTALALEIKRAAEGR